MSSSKILTCILNQLLHQKRIMPKFKICILLTKTKPKHHNPEEAPRFAEGQNKCYNEHAHMNSLVKQIAQTTMMEQKGAS